MKVSTQWLREWVDVDDDIAALAHALTMAGLEIEAILPAGPPLRGVVVGEVLQVEPHPQADKLKVCRVSAGREILQVVCGAPNVRVGMKAPFASVGATLPGGVTIKKAELRGVASEGMLCSARELGLSDDSSGLMDLPSEMQTGDDFSHALSLEDRILEVNLTPNRGDCMSMVGVAREVAAIFGRPLHAPKIDAVKPTTNVTFATRIDAPSVCTRFASRVIQGVRPNQVSPLWMRERLRRAGVRPISLLVDVTNYVLLELGQPMHAYDLARLNGQVAVRFARPGEKLTLLDGRAIELTDDIGVIADAGAAVGIAGVMGGEASGISSTTTTVLLEAAHFVPDAIAGRGRRYGLITDASQRFERGVDPALPSIAIERATSLILEYGGGQAGPVDVKAIEAAPRADVKLRYARVEKVLGLKLESATVDRHLRNLGMQVKTAGSEAAVTAPSWRFDIRIEEDLIEEVARLHGYNNIAPRDALIVETLGQVPETNVPTDRAADALADRGYQETITYSFVDPTWQSLMLKRARPIALSNPISAELGVMRVSLWPGLAHAARTNLNRQQSRVRIFEIGRKYEDSQEIEVIAGFVCGPALPEQWDAPSRKVDFYDVKADVEALLGLTGAAQAFEFRAETHEALHPGQTARIYRDGAPVGWLGALHPEVSTRMDLTYPSFVFELETVTALRARIPESVEISKFPAIRRDIAVILDEGIILDRIQAEIRAAAGLLLRDLFVLSVYRGEQIDKGKKSIALGLNLQDTSRTLTDADADRVVTQVVEHLRDRFGAKLRDK